jgi:hypothetical protein
MQKIDTPIKTEDNNSVKDSSKEDGEDTHNLQWSPLIDKFLSVWCDHAKCYIWMHAESFDYCSKKTRNFMISTNILTAVAGLSNVIAGGYSFNGFQASWIFGGLSILVSTLNVLQDKLGYAQRSEQHRKLSNQWDVIRSKIEEIIILPMNARKDCKSFLKYIKADINLASIDGNSLISPNIRMRCFEKFNEIENFEIPEICGNLRHTKTFNDNNFETVKIFVKDNYSNSVSSTSSNKK